MSFKEYVKEQEELVVLDQEKSKKQKVADLIRTMEDLNDEKFRGFAKEELGMEEPEAEALVYKMLRDFLLAGDKDEDGIPDALDGEGGEELGDLDGLGGLEALGDIEIGGEDEEIPAEDEEEEEFANIDVTEV